MPEDRPGLVEQLRHLLVARRQEEVFGVLGRVEEDLGQEAAFFGHLRCLVGLLRRQCRPLRGADARWQRVDQHHPGDALVSMSHEPDGRM